MSLFGAGGGPRARAHGQVWAQGGLVQGLAVMCATYMNLVAHVAEGVLWIPLLPYRCACMRKHGKVLTSAAPQPHLSFTSFKAVIASFPPTHESQRPFFPMCSCQCTVPPFETKSSV